ncbi:hypothetical protein DRP07_00125 [Archaeoglobales archaeon]|nr:MAG: hypothetical protein DRP07_00125 [Archaeoglobales archaeon]
MEPKHEKNGWINAGVVEVGSKGRIYIPAPVRKLLRIEPGCLVELKLKKVGPGP